MFFQTASGAVLQGTLSAQIRGAGENPIALLEAAARFGVTSLTIKKILSGRPISRYVEKKIRTTLHARLASSSAHRRKENVERFLEVHFLYQKHGTLAATGKELGLSRERVRQLLTKGSKIGLFEYRPWPASAHRGKSYQREM